MHSGTKSSRWLHYFRQAVSKARAFSFSLLTSPPNRRSGPIESQLRNPSALMLSIQTGNQLVAQKLILEKVNGSPIIPPILQTLQSSRMPLRKAWGLPAETFRPTKDGHPQRNCYMQMFSN